MARGKPPVSGSGCWGRVDPNLRAPQALCICPTRELALQNLEIIEKIGKYTGIKVECAVPSIRDKTSSCAVPIHSRAPVSAQIVIGTPGTIKKLMSYKKLGVTCVKVLVFDEADQMLAAVLLFSATFNETVTKFISRVVKDSNKLPVQKQELSLEAVKQYKVYCPDELTKIHVIKTKILELGERLGLSIIFIRTKASARMLHQQLVEEGFSVTSIHGATTAEDRDKIVKEFKNSLTHVLITTDLLARRFDSKRVNLVVNYDLPIKHEPSHGKRELPEPDYELYLHRCGWTGRFGAKGAVINLLCLDWDHLLMENIEKYYNIQVPEVKICEEAFENALRAAGLL